MNPILDFLPECHSLDDHFASQNLQEIVAKALLNPVNDFFEKPGKNLRSQLVELGYRLSLPRDPDYIPDGTLKSLQNASCIVELIHGGSLIVDDIQDSSAMRRNQPSMHVTHGVPVALNAGNWLYFWALTQLKTLNLSAVAEKELMADVLALMMKAHTGQALDLGSEVHLLPQENVHKTCIATMELKTGTLMSLALRLGAAVASEEKPSEELNNLGVRLGTLLQMYDDVGNLFGNSPKKYEDLILRRPSWIWAMASSLPSDNYQSFIKATAMLPDETQLNNWISENDFKNLATMKTSEHKSSFQEEAHRNWNTNHSISNTLIYNILTTLEKSYV